MKRRYVIKSMANQIRAREQSDGKQIIRQAMPVVRGGGRVLRKLYSDLGSKLGTKKEKVASSLSVSDRREFYQLLSHAESAMGEADQALDDLARFLTGKI
jgi:hypothetical protein